MTAAFRLRVLPRVLPIDGREVGFQNDGTYIQWRYEATDTQAASDWTNLVALADITGPEGPNVELRNNGTSLQWRVEGDVSWIDLISIADMTAGATAEAEGYAADAAASAAAALAAVPNAFPATRTILKGYDTATITAAYLREAGREGQFLWSSADLSGTLITATVLSTAVDATLDIVTKAAHGLLTGDAVYPTATVNGLTAETFYYVIGLRSIDYDAESAAFTVGETLTGGTSGATGVIVKVTDAGATGTLLLKTVTGAFLDNETITDGSGGSATADGADTLATDDFMLATSHANAIAGTAIDLTGTTNLTVKRYLDPLEGIYVVATGDAIDGSDGAWVRPHAELEAAWFGFDPDASAAENSAALQAAANFAKPGKLAIHIGAGDHYLSAGCCLNGNSNLTIAGSPGTRLITNSTSAPIFYADDDTAISNLTMTGFTLSANAVRTVWPFLHFRPLLQDTIFDDLIGEIWSSFIWLDQFLQVTFRNCRLTQTSSPALGGVGIRAGTQSSSNQGANLYLIDTKLRGFGSGSATEANWTIGVLLLDVEGVFSDSLDVGDFDTNVVGDPQTRLANCFFEKTYFDATRRGPSHMLRGAGVKSEMLYDACWFASAGRSGGGAVATEGAYGFHAKGSGAFARMQVSDSTFNQNAQNAVVVDTTSFDGDFANSTVYANGLVNNDVAVYVNTAAGNACPNLRDMRLKGNGGSNSLTYTATCEDYIIAGLETDQTVNLLGTPARCEGIIASNSRTISADGTNLPVPQFGTAWVVSSGSSFANIPASWIDRIVTLLFAGSTTVNTGGNLTLASSFGATANATLTLCCIGSSWVEVGRKA